MRWGGAEDAERERGKQRETEKGEGTGRERRRLASALSPPPAPGLSLSLESTLWGRAPWPGIPRAPASHLGRDSVGLPGQGEVPGFLGVGKSAFHSLAGVVTSWAGRAPSCPPCRLRYGAFDLHQTL